MSTGKALLGVLAGIAAGAVLGVLFAPEKGSNTRKKIIESGKDLADSLGDKIEDKFDELTSAVTGKIKKAKAENNSVLTKSELVD